MAHIDASRQRSTLVAFGAKRTLTEPRDATAPRSPDANVGFGSASSDRLPPDARGHVRFAPIATEPFALQRMARRVKERTHALQQTTSLFNQFVGAGVALLGRLALTVAQNLGIAAERIHDCGRGEFDTR